MPRRQQSNRADYVVEGTVIDDETGEPVDLTDVEEIVITISDPTSRVEQITGTYTGGDIILLDENTLLQMTVTADRMRGLCPKNYDVGGTIKMDGQTMQLFIEFLAVVDGIVQ